MNFPKLVTSLAIIGESFDQWRIIKDLCEQTTQDNSGLAVGIISRTIEMDIGSFTVKYLILFIDKKFAHNIKPTFQYSMQQLMEEGIENVLKKIGKKTIIKVQMKMKKDIQSSRA
ncbi:MAG: hypothetical protein ACFFDC_10880 [Promethearchaeota archaeon]